MQVQRHQYSNFAVTFRDISMNTGGTAGQQVMVGPDFIHTLNSVAWLPDKYHGEGRVCWHQHSPKF